AVSWMQRRLFRFGVLTPLLVAAAAFGQEPDGGVLGAADAGPAPGSYDVTETFERFEVGGPPEGFLYRRTGKGAPARWLVREGARARNPTRVLAQTDSDRTVPRNPQALLDNVPIRDVRVSTFCRVLSGRDERSCGVVLRHESEQAYYLARLSVRDGNVCLFAVEAGADNRPAQRELGCFAAALASGRWYGLAASARRNRLEVYFAGKKVIEANDARYPGGARVGVWTGNDSVAEFDELRADAL
ncbi:MAG: hypothetical protein ACYC8T_25800, partial [Myxococcaceae bacterium]